MCFVRYKISLSSCLLLTKYKNLNMLMKEIHEGTINSLKEAVIHYILCVIISRLKHIKSPTQETFSTNFIKTKARKYYRVFSRGTAGAGKNLHIFVFLTPLKIINIQTWIPVASVSIPNYPYLPYQRLTQR